MPKHLDFETRKQYKLRHVWRGMHWRCYQVKRNDPCYPRYRGRGIKVCDAWHEIENFLAWAESKWQEGLELDRIDNDGDYSPENCRFVTPKENARNRANYDRDALAKREKAKKLLARGMTQQQVAQAVGKSQSWVSLVKLRKMR